MIKGVARSARFASPLVGVGHTIKHNLRYLEVKFTIFLGVIHNHMKIILIAGPGESGKHAKSRHFAQQGFACHPPVGYVHQALAGAHDRAFRLFFPEVGVLDAESFRVERVMRDTGLALRLVILECF